MLHKQEVMIAPVCTEYGTCDQSAGWSWERFRSETAERSEPLDRWAALPLVPSSDLKVVKLLWSMYSYVSGPNQKRLGLFWSL